MTQIVLDIDEKLLQTLQQQASEAGATPQQWLEDLISQHLSHEWPHSVRALVGAWEGDFQSAESLRRTGDNDLPRERL